MTEINKLPSELANELKLLFESIYPRYDLLCKPAPNIYGGQIRIHNIILNELLGTLKLIENCTNCKKNWIKDDYDLMKYLNKSIDALNELSNRLKENEEEESIKLIRKSYQNLIYTDVGLNKVVLCNAESKRQEIIKSEKYLSGAKNYKHHVDAFYTSCSLSKLIEQANNKLATISMDDDDDSSNKKIQPNSLIEYNFDNEDELFWENEDNELSEVEGNLNDEIRKGDEGSDNESNESDSTVELYESDGYEND
nr:324_t:CDS:2 [Entrophospora candida]